MWQSLVQTARRHVKQAICYYIDTVRIPAMLVGCAGASRSRTRSPAGCQGCSLGGRLEANRLRKPLQKPLGSHVRCGSVANLLRDVTIRPGIVALCLFAGLRHAGAVGGAWVCTMRSW